MKIILIILTLLVSSAETIVYDNWVFTNLEGSKVLTHSRDLGYSCNHKQFILRGKWEKTGFVYSKNFWDRKQEPISIEYSYGYSIVEHKEPFIGEVDLIIESKRIKIPEGFYEAYKEHCIE